MQMSGDCINETLMNMMQSNSIATSDIAFYRIRLPQERQPCLTERLRQYTSKTLHTVAYVAPFALPWP